MKKLSYLNYRNLIPEIRVRLLQYLNDERISLLGASKMIGVNRSLLLRFLEGGNPHFKTVITIYDFLRNYDDKKKD